MLKGGKEHRTLPFAVLKYLVQKILSCVHCYSENVQVCSADHLESSERLIICVTTARLSETLVGGPPKPSGGPGCTVSPPPDIGPETSTALIVVVGSFLAL